jgi:hypothetical protein
MEMGDKTMLNREDHIKRHKELHRALDELMADMITHTWMLPSRTTVMELARWASEQTENPTEDDEPC